MFVNLEPDPLSSDDQSAIFCTILCRFLSISLADFSASYIVFKIYPTKSIADKIYSKRFPSMMRSLRGFASMGYQAIGDIVDNLYLLRNHGSFATRPHGMPTQLLSNSDFYNHWRQSRPENSVDQITICYQVLC